MISLSQIEKAALAATPGPWDYSDGGIYSTSKFIEDDDGRMHPEMICSNNPVDISFDNERYIALMNPQTTLELVKMIREMRELIEEMATGCCGDSNDVVKWEHDEDCVYAKVLEKYKDV